MMRLDSPRSLALALAGGLLWLGSCGGGAEAPSETRAAGASSAGDGAASETAEATPSASDDPLAFSIDDGREVPEFEPESYDLDIPMVTYAWDPQAGDASVSAEDGGPGFTGEGWTTNLTFPALGSPEAVKGGTIHMYEPSWPVTLRLMGKDYNTAFNYRARDLCQESLVTVHPTRL